MQAPRQMLNIPYLNAQRIGRKRDKLSCVAEEEKTDIILTTKGWCNDDILNAFLSIDGYELQIELRMDRLEMA